MTWMSGNILSFVWFINGRLPVADTANVVGIDVITICTAWFNVQQLNLCVLDGSPNKQRLFPFTVLSGWFL